MNPSDLAIGASLGLVAVLFVVALEAAIAYFGRNRRPDVRMRRVHGQRGDQAEKG